MINKSANYTLPFLSVGEEIVSSQEVFEAATGKVSLALDRAGCQKRVSEAVDTISVTEIGRKTRNKSGDLNSVGVFVSVQVEVTFKEGFDVPKGFDLKGE